MDEYGLIESFKPAPAMSVEEVLRRAALAPDRAEIEQEQAERAAADQRAEQRELTAMLDRAAGSPLQQVTRCQAAVASCREEVDDLEAQLERSRAKLRRAAESLVGWEAEAERVMTAARRQSDDPLTQASRRAHEAFVSVTRAKVAEMAAGTPRRERHPKGHGGHAVRSENCVYCTQEGLDDDTAFLLHSDPERPLAVTTPEQAAAAERREVSR